MSVNQHSLASILPIHSESFYLKTKPCKFLLEISSFHLLNVYSRDEGRKDPKWLSYCLISGFFSVGWYFDIDCIRKVLVASTLISLIKGGLVKIPLRMLIVIIWLLRFFVWWFKFLFFENANFHLVHFCRNGLVDFQGLLHRYFSSGVGRWLSDLGRSI